MSTDRILKRRPGGRATLLGLGVLACLLGVIYSVMLLRADAGDRGANRLAADDLRLLTQDIVVASGQPLSASEQSAGNLSALGADFEERLAAIAVPELSAELSLVEIAWQPLKRSVQVLAETAPRVTFVSAVHEGLAASQDEVRGELAAVVETLQSSRVSPATLVAAQRAPWLAERMTRGMADMLAGDTLAGDQFRSDSGEYLRIVEALTRGDKLTGIDRVAEPAAIEALSNAFRLTSPVTTAADRIADAAPDLVRAAEARDGIREAAGEVNLAIAALVPAIDRVVLGRLGEPSVLLAGFFTPLVLLVGLLAFGFVLRRRRTRLAHDGAGEIENALQRLAEGDLTIHAATDNQATARVAVALNTAAARQGELVIAVREPFEQCVEAVRRMESSARGQLDKGRELTRSVLESATAATEMVRSSEQIKSSTAQAATTSDSNCERVAQGYELTKDMSKASVDVRESLQETSKSAKRQGELIQSVTAAAEYIQTLNTKISVVAINTRIEAEKAGEYGRPFLGIAESVAELLREAQEEGRKILSEVRMLQNMSADNLASMENTVGTVVTILEYIERLDGSLEEINAGSSAISDLIRAVDDVAGKSAVSALHMNNSMAAIRERNKEIGRLNEYTQAGVIGLQGAMREAASSLERFRVDGDHVAQRPGITELEAVESIGRPAHVYAEDEMTALETPLPSTATV